MFYLELSECSQMIDILFFPFILFEHSYHQLDNFVQVKIHWNNCVVLFWLNSIFFSIQDMIVRFRHLIEYGNTTIHRLNILSKIETMQRKRRRKWLGLFRIAKMIMDDWNMHVSCKNIFRYFKELIKLVSMMKSYNLIKSNVDFMCRSISMVDAAS